ncbi:MAG: ATP-binding cassette domain-containing protein, partial [Solobacterium sp.]|nr:ATP-binding cassette domain-containing protein [Solobacterium sp.]
LNEVKELCDRVTVIKKGKTIGVWNIKDVTEADISRYMVGVDVDLDIPKEPADPKENVLVVNDLTIYNEAGKKKVDDVSFSVRRGEIVGIAGVEGNGQREMIDAITGLSKYSYGSIKLMGKEVKDMNIGDLRKTGLVHIPEDRNIYGCARSMSIRDNMIADKISDDRYNNGIFINEKAIKEDTDKWVDEFLVLCDSGDQLVGMLSGGNVQKVVVAREFTSHSELVVCDQPTRGIDVGAAEFVRERMVEMRDAGKAILLISADLAEIMSLSDSLIVMHGGRINAYFPDVRQLTEEDLGFYMLGVKHMSEEEIRGALHE